MGLGGFCPLPLRLGGTPELGWTPEQHARAAADLRAMVQTAPFAVMRFSTGSATPFSYQGQHGIGLAVAPTIVINTGGDASVTWAVAYNDDYDGFYPVRIRHAKATICALGFAGGWCATAELVKPNEVRVRSRTNAGALITDEVCLTVW